jgi:hypothetical protein
MIAGPMSPVSDFRAGISSHENDPPRRHLKGYALFGISHKPAFSGVLERPGDAASPEFPGKHLKQQDISI